MPPSVAYSRILLAAGLYNLLWGTLVVCAPHRSFDWAGFDEPLPIPELWQGIGMIVGVYGIGYLIAAADVRRHWPIVLVGLLGKVLGPIGFAQAVWRGTLPPAMFRCILFNDLIWWIPFAWLLWQVWQTENAAAQTPAVHSGR